jgi:hypothetical protein
MSRKLEPDQQRLAWIRQWRTSSAMLRDQANKELRSLTQADRQEQIVRLLDLAERMRKPRIDNGLVVMKQRLSILFGQESDPAEFDLP